MFMRKFIGDKAFYKKMLIITLPILVQNVITNFVSLIDNMMVGQIGTEQMSGVAIVNQLLFVFNLCIFGGISGAGIFTAQYHGKGDHKGVRDTFRVKLIIVSFISLVFILGLIFFSDRLISLFLHEGEDNLDLAATLEYGKKYLVIMIFQVPLFALSQAYAGTLRETGSTVLPMTAGLVAVVVNITLNWVLIFGNLGAPKLGIEGAAIATVIARAVETLVIMIVTHVNSKKHKFIKGAYRSMRVQKALVKDIAIKGLPLMLNEILWAVGMTVLVSCYSLRGLEVVSAQNISSTVSNLFFCSFFAFGSAIGIIIGNLLGAGELERAKDEDRKIIFTTVIVCAAVGGFMAFMSPMIPQIYNTTDTVKSIATSMLFITSVMIPFNGFIHTCYFTLRCGGKTLITFFFDCVYVWTVCVPVAFCLARFTDLPIIPLYAVVQAVDIIKCVVGFVLVKKGVWINNLVENEK
ncbi:MAG: MATE family efflux transporter [Oscillospiraceae bacterium]|nr:MATE family efflux transporter [Oscillospiraceae bacterium]